MVSGELKSVNPFERFFALLYSLLGLVMSGARGIGWLNDKIQEIIDQPKPILEIEGIAKAQVEVIIRLWEERFPRRGWAITKLLAPFYSPYLCFEPKPPAPDLEERVRKAVFWRRITGICVGIHKVNLGELSTQNYPNWQCWLHEELLLLTGNLYHDFGNRGFRSRIKDVLDSSLLFKIRAGLEKNEKKGGNWYFRGEAPWSLSKNMHNNIVVALEYAVAATIFRDYDLRPFLGLWLAGNLPVGFTRNNKLILLCSGEGK